MVLLFPVAAGLLGSLLPAFGYDPATGRYSGETSPFSSLLAEPGIWHSAGLSLFTGLATTAVSLFFVVAFVASWYGTAFFRVLQHFLSPLLSVPHAAAAFGFAFLLAPSGWLMRILSPWATGFERPPDILLIHDAFGLTMIAGLIGKEVPFLFLMLMVALPQTNAPETMRITQSLGYGRTFGWLKAVFPRVYGQMRLPILAVIVYSSSVVDIAIILGPTTPPPLAVRLTSWMSDPDLSMRMKASAGVVLQIGVTTLALLIWIGLEKFLAAIARPLLSDGRRFRSDWPLKGAGAATMSLLTATACAGLGIIVLWSFAGYWRFPDALPQSISLRTWFRYSSQLVDLSFTTLAIGLGATLAGAVIVVLCLENETRTGRRPGRLGITLLFIPLLVPQVAFLFGLQVLFLAGNVDGTVTAVIFAHLVFVLPYIYLAAASPWHAFDPRFTQTASGLGASRLKTLFRVRLPMLSKSLLTACAVGLAVSVGQYLPTLLIGGGRVPTVTTEAVALASGGNRQLIAIYSVVQMVLPLIGFTSAALIPALLFRHRRPARQRA